MTTSALPMELPMSDLGLDPFLPQNEADWHDIHSHDTTLLTELAEMNQQTPLSLPETGLPFACGELAELARETYDANSLSELERFLVDRGTLDIPILEGHTVMVDGVERNVAMVAATEIGADGANHGEMSSMLYLRDQIQAASALMELSLGRPDYYSEEGKIGKTLLVSALHLMSTPSQLERFDDVIKRGDLASQRDWPQISLHFNDLNGTQPNGWRNKQDTVQMLAYTTLDAIERGFLNVDELAHAHKEFLSSIVPFLAAVGFPCYENSGSWEEVTARRTSVMAIETALLCKIKTLTDQGTALDFLKDSHTGAAVDFDHSLDVMIQEGLHELGARLPYESADYATDSIKFRDSDAALAYVLRYDLPHLLANNNIPMAINDNKPMSAKAIEDIMLIQLSRLIDPETGGIIRYEGDSYQRVNFHTNAVQMIIKAIKGKVQHDAARSGEEVDLDQKQSLRAQLTPEGRPAAWTHPLSQIASWAANRSRTEIREGRTAEAVQYSELSTHFLNAALSTVTGENQWHAALNEAGHYQIRKVPAYKLPECYITYRMTDGSTFHVPSPHTPLNWSSAMLKEAIGLLGMCTK